MLTAERLTARDVLADGGTISQFLPGYAERPGQLELAAAIEHAIETEKNLVAEAGTGVGKSLAYLVPAILSGKQTVVSTATKVLQDQLWTKDVPSLQAWLPTPFTAAILKGRSNYVCLDQLDGAQPRLGSNADGRAWESFTDWHSATETGDLDSWAYDAAAARNAVTSAVTVSATECHGRSCRFARQCWSEKARTAAKHADVVIANHHLLVMSRCADVSLLPMTPVTVVDECHHLEEVASNVLGAKLSPASWPVLRGRIAAIVPKDAPDSDAVLDALDELGSAITDAFATMSALVDTTYNGTSVLPDHTALYETVVAASQGIRDALRAPIDLETDEDTAKRERRRQSLIDYLHKLWMVMVPADDVVRYVEVSGQQHARRLMFCARFVDVSDHLRRGIWEPQTVESASAIAVSATVAAGVDFDPWIAATGANADITTLVAPSPFNYREQALLYLPDDAPGLTPPTGDRDARPVMDYLDRLAAEMRRLVEASGGRAFLLFTSHAALDRVYGSHLVDGLFKRYPPFRQGDTPPRQMVASFLKSDRGILYGTRSFWEGVDIPGAALSLVVIDKLPFSSPGDPVWDAKVEAIKLAGGDWFGGLALPHCVITLKQGVGRLIRSTADRGVIAILDGRLVTKGYGGRILRALPPATRTRSVEDVQDFFEEDR